MTSQAGSRTEPSQAGHGFGTAPVFLASISTILGAILFLRFGYAVGHVGLWGTMMIIVIGHMVTIPTVLAVSEIATNRRVAGGGAYFIISRSFGTTIGGSIGIALYLSQAISVAFYLVAFAEAFQPVFAWVTARFGITPTIQWISIPGLAALVALMLTKGAEQGVRVLWIVCAILAVVIVAFLFGTGPPEIRPDGLNLTSTISEPDGFGIVFATCFPAFTGMIAGLGLSGDLKDPKRSIPLGTIGATLVGMAVYALVAIKLAQSATPEALAEDQFIMARIAVWGPSIYIGLAAAAFSSALGSIMVAPRTLQALARRSLGGIGLGTVAAGRGVVGRRAARLGGDGWADSGRGRHRLDLREGLRPVAPQGGHAKESCAGHLGTRGGAGAAGHPRQPVRRHADHHVPPDQPG